MIVTMTDGSRYAFRKSVPLYVRSLTASNVTRRGSRDSGLGDYKAIVSIIVESFGSLAV